MITFVRQSSQVVLSNVMGKLQLCIYYVDSIYPSFPKCSPSSKPVGSLKRWFFFFHLFLLVGGQPFHNIAVGFVIHWHESAMELHVFPMPIPPPTSLSTWFLWVFPVHQARALVSCIPPGLVICFTIDTVHADLSKHPTLAFSHRVQKSVLYICVSFSVLHIGLSLPSF